MSPSAIETTSLTRRFGDVLAVDHLDLEVPRGGVYAFLGPNGAGKTTTIRMLLGLIRPHEGGVRLFGEALDGDRRLVEDQELGLAEKRQGQAEALAHAEGIAVRPLGLGAGLAVAAAGGWDFTRKDVF